MQKPYSASCERNVKPICKVLKEVIGNKKVNLLELGSGTGQHAAYLASQFSNITWTCSDVQSNHEGIKHWISETKNVKGPLTFEIEVDSFPDNNFDIVYTANTFHIMEWEKDKTFIKLCGENLKKDSLIIIYGPFNYKKTYSSKSNADFDLWLKARNPQSAIRNFEDVNEAMELNGFTLQKDYEMPANNRTLVFKKI